MWYILCVYIYPFYHLSCIILPFLGFRSLVSCGVLSSSCAYFLRSFVTSENLSFEGGDSNVRRRIPVSRQAVVRCCKFSSWYPHNLHDRSTFHLYVWCDFMGSMLHRLRKISLAYFFGNVVMYFSLFVENLMSDRFLPLLILAASALVALSW